MISVSVIADKVTNPINESDSIRYFDKQGREFKQNLVKEYETIDIHKESSDIIYFVPDGNTTAVKINKTVSAYSMNESHTTGICIIPEKLTPRKIIPQQRYECDVEIK